jgi:alpha-ribazole phosphatase
MKIFLVRHGEVEGNSGPRPTFSGWNDVALTARGELQAKAIAARLQNEDIRAIHSSDLSRAHETAKCIALSHTLEVRTSPAWREVDYGAWSGLGEGEIVKNWRDLWAQKKADQFGVAAPEGESGANVWQRLLPRWNELIEEARAASTRGEVGATVLVAHNGPLRLLICHLLEAPLRNFRRVRIDNCGLTCVEIGAETQAPLLRFINQTCHLEGV